MLATTHGCIIFGYTKDENTDLAQYIIAQNGTIMDRLHLIEVFISVAEAESFSGAARSLDMSPAAVSRAIAALEAGLNVKLLNRSTRSVRVTEAGQIYLDLVRRIVSEIDEADEAAAGINAEPRGRLTVTAPVQFGKMYVTPAIVEYLGRYPEMEVSGLFLDRVVNLLEEGLDVAIRIGDLPDSSLRAIRVGQVRKVVCASPKYLENHPKPQIPAELTQHLIVAATSVTPTTEWKFHQGAAITTVRVKPRFFVSSIEGALAAVSKGFGITRLMSYQVAPYLSTGQLKTILTEYEPPPLPIHVLHNEGRYSSIKVRTFIDHVVAKFRTDIMFN
jgi:DNA-binding transcriptional LysR family regulator